MTILLTKMSTRDNLLQMIGVSLLFIVILVITYYTTKFVGGAKMGMVKNNNFKVIETFKVAQNKYLQIIQIGTRYFVIAVGKDDIHVLTELNESDLVLKDNTKLQKGNFGDIFHLAIHKQKDKTKKDDQKEDH